MRSKLMSFLTVIGAVTVLVLAANTVAFATTGKSLIAGKTNSTSKVTTIKRTKAGSALKVTTKSNANPPFAVNGKGKVANLSADTVDGYDSSTMLTRAYVFNHTVTDPPSGALTIPLPVPTGKYLASYSAFLIGTANAFVDCYLQSGSPTKNVGESRLTAGPHDAALSGSGYLEVKTATNARAALVCDGGGFITDPGQPIQIVLTRVNVATSTSTSTSTRVATPSARKH